MRIRPDFRPFQAVAFVGIGIALAACSSPPTSSASERPSCVTLESYSSVIQQVMNVYPSWGPLEVTPGGYVTRWRIELNDAAHQLMTIVTRNECICATVATSHFPSGSPEAQFAGYLQGAAVAPLSDLDYTSSWLQPKIILSCPLAFLMRRQYVSSDIMDDGTIWKLECRRSTDPAFADLEYTFGVATESCQASLP